MAKTMIQTIEGSKAWTWVALGALGIGTFFVVAAIREQVLANKAEAESEEAHINKKATEGIAEEVTTAINGNGSTTGNQMLGMLVHAKEQDRLGLGANKYVRPN